MRYVYGIISTEVPVRFDVDGVDAQGDGVHTVGHRGIHAVVSPTARADYRGMTRQDALPCLLAHQRAVEAVMERFTILPVRFGTVLPDEARVRRLLEQGERLFRQALDELGGKVQMEVVVTWDLPEIFKEIGAEEEVAQARTRVAGKPPEETAADRVAIGQMVKASLDRRRADLCAYLLPRLGRVTLDLLANPLLDDGMVANVALLLDQAQRETLDRHVHELDRHFGGGLTFRCVGPLPPYSFAVVEVEVPTFEAVDAARRRLGLGATATLEEIERAYRRLAGRLHPDVNPAHDAQVRMAELAQAYRLLTAYGTSQARVQGRAGDAVCDFGRQAVARRLLISVVRQDGLPRFPARPDSAAAQ